jgi:hypothetical protein
MIVFAVLSRKIGSPDDMGSGAINGEEAHLLHITMEQNQCGNS